eukprot:scaffold24286_cov30-Tisochrysis_lutea.AAC.1
MHDSCRLQIYNYGAAFTASKMAAVSARTAIGSSFAKLEGIFSLFLRASPSPHEIDVSSFDSLAFFLMVAAILAILLGGVRVAAHARSLDLGCRRRSLGNQANARVDTSQANACASTRCPFLQVAPLV